jgi:multidrug efflux pump subunit AcrA (membrane-fusion protein)
MAKPRRKPRATDATVGVDAFCNSRNACDLKVVSLAVEEGDMVEAGQLLAVLDYYKIATEITAPVGGRITRIHVRLDDEVQVGDRLIDLEPA